MSLITCPRCGHNVSNHAVTCPKCKLPVAQFQKEIDQSADIDQLRYEAKTFGAFIAPGLFTVVLTGRRQLYGLKYFNSRFEAVTNTGVCALSQGSHSVMLLTESGRVALLTTDLTDSQYPALVERFTNVKKIANGSDQMLALCANGSVAACGTNWYNACDISNWKNIVDIAAGPHHSVGLTSKGTVIVAGECEEKQNLVKNWRNIIAVSAGRYHTVGLQKNGRVISVGYKTSFTDISDSEFEAEQTNVFLESFLHPTSNIPLYVRMQTQTEDNYTMDLGWNNIIAISAGSEHTVGLRYDGTVVATGRNKYGQCNVENWRDIMAITAGGDVTAAIKRDGSILITGNCKNIDEIMNINIFQL